MEKLVDMMVIKIEKLNAKLSNDEISALSAGLKDIISSHNKLINSLTKINEAKDNDEFQNAVIELQIELLNHIKPHIVDMEKPLMKIINSLG